MIIGTFNKWNAPAFPCLHPRMRVLFTLTNGKGDYDLRPQVEHEASGQRLMELGGRLLIDDPLAIADVDIEMCNLIFPEPGKYWVVLKADGRIVQQRPFLVSAMSPEVTHAQGA